MAPNLGRLVRRLDCAAAPVMRGDTQYYEHSFFDNSAMPDAYFYSSGKPSAPSTLELIHGHLPVNTKSSSLLQTRSK